MDKGFSERQFDKDKQVNQDMEKESGNTFIILIVLGALVFILIAALIFVLLVLYFTTWKILKFFNSFIVIISLEFFPSKLPKLPNSWTLFKGDILVMIVLFPL